LSEIHGPWPSSNSGRMSGTWGSVADILRLFLFNRKWLTDEEAGETKDTSCKDVDKISISKSEQKTK